MARAGWRALDFCLWHTFLTLRLSAITSAERRLAPDSRKSITARRRFGLSLDRYYDQESIAWHKVSVTTCYLVLTLGMILGAAACYGQTDVADDVLSPLVATPIAAPNPVLGADDKTHLAYEIVLMNMGSTTVGLDNIETLDAITGTVHRDPAPELSQEIAFVGDPLDVGAPAVVVSPPLKGARWVVAGGCCTPYSYHRAATLSINGTIHVAERYAIDFVQLNDKNKLYSGPPDQLSSYAFFGAEVHSVADGIVVRIADSLPEQVPGKLPEGATIQMLAGNHVVVDIGEGRYAFYAHMQPGSLRVKVGDKVVTGQVLASSATAAIPTRRISICMSWTVPRRFAPTGYPMCSPVSRVKAC
jgi:Peptidase family M23